MYVALVTLTLRSKDAGCSVVCVEKDKSIASDLRIPPSGAMQRLMIYVSHPTLSLLLLGAVGNSMPVVHFSTGLHWPLSCIRIRLF
jgi:hypothetical protein